MNPPVKYQQHGRNCTKCYAADGPKTMCRVGRRLYVGWFNSLDNDGKMFALTGMPAEMRQEVLACADITSLGNVSFGNDQKPQ